MSSLSTSQRLSLVALVIAGIVFLGALARFSDSNDAPPPTASEVVAATRDCIKDAKTDAEIDACSDRSETSQPWYERQPVLASLVAGGITFFVIAGGGRLLMK